METTRMSRCGLWRAEIALMHNAGSQQQMVSGREVDVRLPMRRRPRVLRTAIDVRIEPRSALVFAIFVPEGWSRVSASA
jgi:hypothetical protein